MEDYLILLGFLMYIMDTVLFIYHKELLLRLELKHPGSNSAVPGSCGAGGGGIVVVTVVAEVVVMVTLVMVMMAAVMTVVAVGVVMTVVMGWQ